MRCHHYSIDSPLSRIPTILHPATCADSFGIYYKLPCARRKLLMVHISLKCPRQNRVLSRRRTWSCTQIKLVPRAVSQLVIVPMCWHVDRNLYALKYMAQHPKTTMTQFVAIYNALAITLQVSLLSWFTWCMTFIMYWQKFNMASHTINKEQHHLMSSPHLSCRLIIIRIHYVGLLLDALQYNCNCHFK